MLLFGLVLSNGCWCLQGCATAMRLSTWLKGVLLFLFIKTGGKATEAFIQQQVEWVNYGWLPNYAQGTAFSLLSFNVPPLTVKAEFSVMLIQAPTGNDGRKVLYSLRKAAIPVLQAYNETLPDSYVLPSDQQIFQTSNQTIVTLTLNSPAPGRIYLAATVLNPITDVIEFLRWGQKIKGQTAMSVTAVYTMLASVASLSVDDLGIITSADGVTQIYSFRVPGFTMSYSVSISNCRRNGSSSSNCPLTMMVADSLGPDSMSSVSVDCRLQAVPCQLAVQSPTLEQDHYITFFFDNSTGQDLQNITFDVRFHVQDCKAVNATTGNTASFDDPPALIYISGQESTIYGPTFSSNAVSMRTISTHPSRKQTGIGQLENPVCINSGYLGRKSYPSKATSFSFNAEFGLWSSDGIIYTDFVVSVPDTTTDVRTFALQESLDSGGDLFLGAQLQNEMWEGMVWICAMPHRLAQNGSVDRCVDGALLVLNATDRGNESVSSQAFLHFPTSGTWYITMQSQCSDTTPCGTLPLVQLSIRLGQCAPDYCGKYGDCQIYTDVNLVFAGCDCYAGFRGLQCNDDTYSLSDTEQLRAVYLLTLSNLAFLPAIGLALYRRYFILAAIFFFTFFFSSFYHACDSSHVYQKCIMDYDTLSFCDFFGSLLSFYALLLFMARVPDHCRSFLLVAGALVIAVFQNSLRHNDLAHIVPLGVAGGIMLVSWVFTMRRRKKLYPSRRRYLLFLLPGMVLAAVGIGVNYGLMWHQSTYQYTHSFWHLALMLAPCFLMPPQARKFSGSKKGLSVSAQDIIRAGDLQYQQFPVQDEQPSMFDASMNSIRPV